MNNKDTDQTGCLHQMLQLTTNKLTEYPLSSQIGIALFKRISKMINTVAKTNTAERKKQNVWSSLFPWTLNDVTVFKET